MHMRSRRLDLAQAMQTTVDDARGGTKCELRQHERKLLREQAKQEFSDGCTAVNAHLLQNVLHQL
jgi:hypothetical protein